ncbi:glycosyltransferase [Caldisphaera lagunensis]|nr:glycosyltransferase family 2 protein [Caldisphaera lagunensis]
MQVQYIDLNQIQTLLKVINVEYQSYLPKWAMIYIAATGTIASLLAAVELAIFVSPMNSTNKYNVDDLKKKLSYYPLVSIILPSYKEGDLLKRALKSINEQTYPHNKIEVILAVEKDDNTIDKALDIVGLSNCKENCCSSSMGDIKTKIVYGKGNGKPSALNEALKCVEGEIIGVLDADDILTKNAIITAVSYLVNQDIDAIQLPREVILDKESKKTFKGAHIRAQEAEMFLYTKLLAPVMEKLSGISWVMGSGYFVKKDVLNKLGGWEEKAATEDLDLSIRMIASGYKIKVISESPVYTEPVRNYSQLITQKERWVRGMLLLVPKVLRHPRKSWPLLSIYLMPIAEYATILWPIMAPYALKYAIIAFFIEFLIGFASYYTIYKRVGKTIRPLPIILAIYGITSWIALAKLVIGRAHEWKGTRLTKGIKVSKK